MPTAGDQYWQEPDGLWVENVGPWVKEKHRILADYVQIAGATRRKFQSRCFIDVFCGPGKARIRDTAELVDGSSLVAYRQSMNLAPFTSVCVSDADPDLLHSVSHRLAALPAPVQSFDGPASNAVPNIVQSIDPYGLHLALLDPHNLGALSFDLFEGLAKLKRVDVIVHVSLGDLQRNADRYSAADQVQFDNFAPGWRDHVGTDMNQQSLRAAILDYWTNKVAALGLPRAQHCELIRGTKKQRLYWLMLLAGHQLPHSFWNKITSSATSPTFDF